MMVKGGQHLQWRQLGKYRGLYLYASTSYQVSSANGLYCYNTVSKEVKRANK